jgi:sugar transferase (PEP-CTERM system associated)
VSWRFSYRIILKHGIFDQRIFLLGPGELAENIKKEIKNKTDCGYSVFLEYPNNATNGAKTNKIYNREVYDGLCQKAKELEIDKIVVALKEKRETFPMDELLECKMAGIEVVDGNSFYEMLTGKLIVREIHPTWFIFSDGFQKSGIRRFFKRFLDLLLSLSLLVVLIPLIIITVILIKIDSRGTIFYSQERIGEKRKAYRIYKFRSMIEDAEKECGPVCATEDDYRITRIGKIIRKLRIDEIPQLWNVLKGDMSFVGPRPEREFFVEKYEKKIPYYGERFSVKPGITGWAQICYRYSDTIEDTTEKLNYDLFYIKNMSPMMDLMIVLRTIKIVLFGRGAR